MSADLTAALDRIEGLAGAATEGPWAFAIAPASLSDETPAEWMAAALTGEGPLYTLYVPATVGDPDGFTVPAVTGDGSGALDNAAFIADARTTVPDLVAVVRAVLAVHVPDAHGPGRCDLDECVTECEADGEDWPCATVQAITTAWEAQR